MPIWFQIDRSRVRLSECRFGILPQLKWNVSFISWAAIWQAYVLGNVTPSAPRPSDLAHCLRLPSFRASGPRSCDVTSLDKYWLSPGRVYLWQLEGFRIAQLLTKMHKTTHVGWVTRVSQVQFWSQTFGCVQTTSGHY